MIFFVYSKLNQRSIADNVGVPEYSYYFVLKEYLPVLKQLGEVVIVDSPDEVDTLYEEAYSQGKQAYYLSFMPPHLTRLGLKCPTIPVFAWEFNTLPNEAWWADQPQDDWTHSLRQCNAAIVHSEFTVKSVRDVMGDGFPVLSIPAPVWDKYASARLAPTGTADTVYKLQVDNAIVFDTHARNKDQWFPNKAVLRSYMDKILGNEPVTAAAKLSAWQLAKHHFKRWREQLAAEKNSNTEGPHWQRKTHYIKLSGVVFTSVFNPYDGRKNWGDMLTAFCIAFKDRTDATLVFKLGHRRYRTALRNALLTLARFGDIKCRVILIHGHLPDEDYQRLTQATHFIVNTSYGEGQCLPLMEYLSSGKPAIAPRHSAMLDYMDETLGFVVRSFADYTAWPHDPRVAYRTLRHQIDWSSLVKCYQQAFLCFTEEPERYQQLSKNAIERMRGHCSQAHALNQLRRIFGMLPTKPVRHSIEQLSQRMSAEEWLNHCRDPHFIDARNTGFVDCVKSGWYQSQTGELFSGFPISPEDDVLEIGCGAGGASLFCAKQGAAVTFVDVNSDTVDSVAKKLHNSQARAIKGIVSDSQPLPLDDEYASRIIAMEVLEHVTDPLVVLKELVRVGKPNALYLFSVPDALGEHIQKPLAPASYYQHPNHIHIFEREAFAKLVEEAGLQIIKHDSYGFFWMFWMMLHWTSLRAGGEEADQVAHDAVQPPYFPLTNQWAQLWDQMMQLPGAEITKRQLDNVLPKSQIIVARKISHVRQD